MKILEENEKELEVTILEYCALKCHNRLWHQRQIRGEEAVHRKAILIEAFIIRQFNALPPRTELVPGWNIPINKVKGLTYFKDNTLPEEAREELTAVWCEDILTKPAFDSDWNFEYKFYTRDDEGNSVEKSEIIHVTYDVHLAALADINRHQKKGAEDNTFDISEVRRACTTNDIKSRIAVNDKVHYMGNPFIPIEVKPKFEGIYKSSYWNASVQEVVDDYWAFKSL